MTTPDSFPPPFGDATDDALSALLDGELAGFAADHGTTEPEVRAALEAWPGTDARLAELSRARASISTPVPPLDDVTRHRLVTGALPPTSDAPASAPRRRRPDGTWLGLAAAAVVVVLVIVAVGAMVLSRDDGGSEQADSGGSSSVAGAAPAPRGELGALGDVTDPARLRALLDGDTDTDDSGREPAGGSATLDDGSDPAESSSPDALANAAEADPGACAAQLAGSRPVRFVGTGSYQGRAVVVVGLDQGGRTIAFVVPVDDCTTVLTSISR